MPQTQGTMIDMTEEEAEAFAARLARVWAALTLFELDRGIPYFSALLTQDVELQVSVMPISDTAFCWHFALRSPHEISPLSVFLYCNDVGETTGHSLISCPQSRFLRQRQSEWMPFFRRGLWLSGCAIEASAHEKAEWMQGFSQEELQAWDLKM